MTRAVARAFARACLALGGWLALGAPGVSADAASETGGDVHDVFFLGGERPILVRFHVQIGERPLGTAWSDAVATLHEYLDSGDAGSTPKESELGDLARVLRGPVAVQVRPPATGVQDTTFARIDVDGDGKLGTDEREEAATRLRMFDQNDDESISNAELAAFLNPNLGVLDQEVRGNAEPPPPVLLIDRSVSRIQTVQQVLNRFDTGGPEGARSKDHRLSRSEIRLAAEVFRQFDIDRDGTLDGGELMQFLDKGDPAVELIVRLGPRPSKRPRVELVAGRRPDPALDGSPQVRMLRTDETLVTIVLGDVWLDIHTEDSPWDAARARQAHDRLFQDLDADRSKSLSLAEVRGREPFPRLFKLIDRNGDGQVVKGEMNAALALFEDLWRGQAVLTVADRGVLLFGNLDTSGDGRLGLRELREASVRLASFDRSGDGQVTAAEIPHRFEWSLSQAPMPLGFVTPGNPNVPTAGASGPVPAAGPRWFQTMDRNHDGDLSPREFLGPCDDFVRLDADGDGLIDAVEARGARTP